MSRSRMISIFVSNVSNVVVHMILEKSIEDEYLRKHYNLEYLNFLEISRIYRRKINPINKSLPEKDVQDIKKKIKIIVANELKLRISKGYSGIDLDLIDAIIDKKLKELKI